MPTMDPEKRSNAFQTAASERDSHDSTQLVPLGAADADGDAGGDGDGLTAGYTADDTDWEDPLDWPAWRKWAIISLVTTTSFLGNYGTITIVPTVPSILQEFNSHNEFYLTFLVSIWELGEAIGQFFVGPASERFGRLPVFLVGNSLFVLCSAGSALSVNVQMLTALRFLNGCFNTTITLSPSIVGDLYRPEVRGRAMSFAIAIPLFGPFLAPVIGSYTAEALGWRWAIWIVVIAVAIVTLLSCFVFKETYRVKILQRRARKLQSSFNDDDRRKAVSPIEPCEQQQFCGAREPRQQWRAVLSSIGRPAIIFFTNADVFLISIYSGFTYGISYLLLTTLADAMQRIYSFSEGDVGNAFLARAVGNVLGVLLYAVTSDRYLQHIKKREGKYESRHRLMLLVIGSTVLPLGLLLYGWTARRDIHWITPLIGTMLVGFSMILGMLPTNNYLVDTFDIHGASAVAAASSVAALFGTFLPLLSGPLYGPRLGLGWGNSILAILSALFVGPLVWLWQFKGKAQSRQGITPV